MSLVHSFSMRTRSVAIAVAFLLTACGPKDADIKAGADAALGGAPGVTVDVAAGVATIAGEFANDSVKAATEAKVKEVKGVKSVVNNATVTPPPPPPPAVVMSPDDSLLTSVGTVLAEFPTLSATVANGVVTLTGEITRADLPKMMQGLSALNPRKIVNKAAVKK